MSPTRIPPDIEEDIYDVGSVLRDRRTALGLTEAELAERAGVTEASLRDYEADVRPLDDDTFKRLAVALGDRPERLMFDCLMHSQPELRSSAYGRLLDDLTASPPT